MRGANGHSAVLQAATPLAAVMQWFIKDFSGHVAGVLFAGYQVCPGSLQTAFLAPELKYGCRNA